jgi:GT2 family glycosyltransferase
LAAYNRAPMPERIPRAVPAISVIVAQDSYRPTLACLDAFLSQSVTSDMFEIIIVDWSAGESYETRTARARSHANAPTIKYARCKDRGRAAMNNLGVSLANAPLLCFCADDFVPGPTFVAAHLAHHELYPELNRIGVGGALAAPAMRDESPFLAWLEDNNLLFGVRFHDANVVVPPDYFYAANSSIKRELFERVGRFDEMLPFPTHDDWEFGRRLVRHDTVSEWIPGALCIHDHVLNLEERIEHMRQAGASAAMLNRRSAHAPREQAARRRAQLRRFLTDLSRDRLVGTYWRLALACAYASAYARELVVPTVAGGGASLGPAA